MNTRSKKSVIAAALLASVAFVAVGCASGGTPATSAPTAAPSETSSAPKELQPVHMTEIAGINAMFFQYGAAKGYFADEGIDLTVDAGQAGGSAAIPALISGGLDIAGSNIGSTLQAFDQGQPIVIISGGSVAAPPPNDWSAVIVGKNSGLKNYADLSGKTVAINALGNFNEVYIRTAVEADGGDGASVNFVQYLPADMPAAIIAGNVDAGVVGDPYRYLAKANNPDAIDFLDGGRGYSAMKDYIQGGTYITTQQYAAAHPDIIAEFRAAMVKTADDIKADPESFRQALVDIVDMDPAVAEGINLPAWTGKTDLDSIKLWAKAHVKWGVISAEPDYDELVLP